jgi:predicted nucleic acid-binding protein
MPVIDASLYVALVNEGEPAHAASWRWFEAAVNAGESVSAPVILLPEAGAALSRGVGDVALAHRVVAQLVESEVIDLIPISSALAERAAAIAIDGRIRGCDSVYVALAEQMDDMLVTLDGQQLERAKPYVQTRTP